MNNKLRFRRQPDAGYRFFHVEGNFYQRPYSQWLTYDQGQIRSSDNYIYFDCPRMIDTKELYPIAHFDYPATNTKEVWI